MPGSAYEQSPFIRFTTTRPSSWMVSMSKRGRSISVTSAAHKNSENVLVLWNNPSLAKIYLTHWESRFARGKDFQPNE